MSDETPAPVTNPKIRTITLDFDVEQNGAVLIPAGTKIVITKPMGGALRGTNLGGMIRMDYDQVELLTPRITTPMLNPKTMLIDPSDIAQISGEIVDFLLPKAAKDALFPAT